MELTVASTTDTQKDIDKAAGLEKEEQQSSVVVAEPESQKPEAEEEVKKPTKSAAQRRFDALVRRNKELEAQLEEQGRSSQTQAAPETEVEQPQVQLPPRPKQDDKDAQGRPKYTIYEDYEDALMDWKIDQRQAKEAEQAAQQAAAEAQQRIDESFDAQCAEAKEKYPDFDRMVAGAPQIYTGTGQAIKEMENGAEIMYYLATHRDIAQKLLDMGPVRSMAEVGRIAAQLGTNVEEPEEDLNSEEEEQEEKPVHKASPPPRRASSAPAPIKPVGGSATKSSVPLDELPYNEYRRLREQQIKNRYRR